MKRKQHFFDRKNVKRLKLDNCVYCKNNIYSNNLNQTYFKLTCNHYSHIKCINRFLRTNSSCHYCYKKSKDLDTLYQNMSININFCTH